MESESVRLSRRLIEEGEKTERFFQLIPPEILGRQLYTDGGQWEVGQLMAHFLATEIGITVLIRSILDGNPGTPEDFDIDRYNEKKISELRGLPLAELIERFHAARQRSAELVSTLNEEQLNMSGRHPYLGMIHVKAIVQLLYRHNQLHQRDIRHLQVDSTAAKDNSLI